MFHLIKISFLSGLDDGNNIKVVQVFWNFYEALIIKKKELLLRAGNLGQISTLALDCGSVEFLMTLLLGGIG
jgi:hypothetical protein